MAVTAMEAAINAPMLNSCRVNNNHLSDRPLVIYIATVRQGIFEEINFVDHIKFCGINFCRL